ncbi:MAG: phosphate signaling complex protein PhoU [Anaerolineales bacterium]|nr:phosphate signaling complex protein PhoU [Anaerolineales bacterium]MCB0013564.1 phosphate signaling complex protein PhoU [Anaerolineales bacterium]
MSMPRRSILEQELNQLDEDILRLASLVNEAISQGMQALYKRDVALAHQVVANDEPINQLRYELEQNCLKILATQQPAASDLRKVIAAIHLAVELERIGDHAAGIARVVERLEEEAEIESLHKLPKMAERAQDMLQQAVQAFVDHDVPKAKALFARDDKIDKQYNRLFRETMLEMQDDAYIRRANYLLWVGHNLERMGDRAINIAERVVFMVTNQYIEDMVSFD